MPKRSRVTDEDWRKAGYIVERLGDGCSSIWPEKHPDCPPEPDMRPLSLKRLQQRLRALPQAPDRPRELIQRYDTIIDFLIRHFCGSGPLSTKEYNQLYQGTHLNELYRAVLELGGPPLVCQECLRVLKGRPKRYCSPTCKKTFKIRQYREKHPEHKMRRR